MLQLQCKLLCDVGDEFRTIERKGANATHNFTKGVKISPDGRCILVNSDDNVLRLFELNEDSHGEPYVAPSSVVRVHEGSCIYDFQWYPFLNSHVPESCVFLSSSQGNPVHLWDAYNGKLCASYCPRNHLDEISPAFSIAFTATGEKIITGHNRMIRLFDTQRPTDPTTHDTLSTSRKSKMGQRGIISTLHSNPDYSTIYAAGSYNGSTCVYAENSCDAIMELERHNGGVNQVKFSNNGKFLFTAARKDPWIRCWDIRNTGEILARYERGAATNQKIAFDLHSDDNILVTGSQDRRILFYDTSTGKVLQELSNLPDSVNGVSFAPNATEKMTLALSTGQRYINCDSEDEAADFDDKRSTVQLWSVSSPPAER